MSPPTNHPADAPYVEIIEQPAKNSARFRYECESRTGGCIQGKTSRPDSKTWPAIKVHNHVGPVVIVVSLVTADDEKPKPHPHRLVGTNCNKGVCTMKYKQSLDCIKFQGLGIQCVKKNECAKELNARKEIRVDPFRTGFDHNSDTGIKKINLNAAKLCFQVFLPDNHGKYQRPLKAVASESICDKKNATELVICELSHASSPMEGGVKMIALTMKLPKDDIQLRFFKMRGSGVEWEKCVKILPKDMHQQVAFTFKTPDCPLQPPPNSSEVSVHVQLQRISQPEECSPSIKFKYHKSMDGGFSGYTSMARKRHATASHFIPNTKLLKTEAGSSANSEELPALSALQTTMSSTSSNEQSFGSGSQMQPQSIQNQHQSMPPQHQGQQPQGGLPPMTAYYPPQSQGQGQMNYQYMASGGSQSYQPPPQQQSQRMFPQQRLSAEMNDQMYGMSPSPQVLQDVNLSQGLTTDGEVIALQPGQARLMNNGEQVYIVAGPRGNPQAQPVLIDNNSDYFREILCNEDGEIETFPSSLSENLSEILQLREEYALSGKPGFTGV